MLWDHLLKLPEALYVWQQHEDILGGEDKVVAGWSEGGLYKEGMGRRKFKGGSGWI